MRRWCSTFAVLLATLLPVSMVSCDDPTDPEASTSRPGKKKQAPPNDLALVEKLLQARKDYQIALENLREYYDRQGDPDRKAWVEDELYAYHRISKRAYRLDLDVPPPTLKPENNVPEANELYRRAMGFKENRILSFSSQAGDNLRRAEILLQQLLTNYPQCDKIDDAAYHLGDVYESSTFKQYRRAAAYFERCFQWNPNTDTDARIRAARLYDRTLNDRSRALQLYRDVTQYDANQKRVDEARKRLTELSGSRP
jgi:TolA-binding protein